MTSIAPAAATGYLEGLKKSFDAVADKQNLYLRTIAEASQAFTTVKPSFWNRVIHLLFGRKKLYLTVGEKTVPLSVASYDNASNMGALRKLFSVALGERKESLKEIIPFVCELERRFGRLDQADGCLGLVLNKAADEGSILESLRSVDLKTAFLGGDEEHKEALITGLLRAIPKNVIPSRAKRLGMIYSALQDPQCKGWFENYAQKRVVGADMINATTSPEQKQQFDEDLEALHSSGLDVTARIYAPQLEQLSAQWEKKVQELTKKLDEAGKADFSAVAAECDEELLKLLQEEGSAFISGIKTISSTAKELLGGTCSQMQMRILGEWKVHTVSKGIQVLETTTLDEKKGVLLFAQSMSTSLEQRFPGARPTNIIGIMDQLKEMQRKLTEEISSAEPKVSILTKAQRTAEKVFRIGKRVLPSGEFLIYIGISAAAGYAEGGLFGALTSGGAALFSRGFISLVARAAGNWVTASFFIPDGAVKNTVITCVQATAMVLTWNVMMQTNTFIAGGIDAYWSMPKPATGLGLATEVPSNIFKIMWGGVKTVWYSTKFGVAPAKVAADVLGGGAPPQVVHRVFMDTFSGARASYRAGYEAVRTGLLSIRNFTWWTRIL